MEELKTGNYEFELAFFGVSDMGNIQLIVKNSTIVDVATAFSSDEPTMTHIRGDEETEYTGFTVLQVIAPMDTGIRVSVRRKYVGE